MQNTILIKDQNISQKPIILIHSVYIYIKDSIWWQYDITELL